MLDNICNLPFSEEKNKNKNTSNVEQYVLRDISYRCASEPFFFYKSQFPRRQVT